MKKSDILKNGRINNSLQVFGIRRYTIEGGAENGLRVIECTNGKLRFLLNASKALDIMQICYEGKNMSFISKNGYTAREIPFLNRFEGGALYTCGLDVCGRKEGMDLHGSFHNIPANVLRAECAEDGIVVEAEMRYSALFGQNLVMRRKIFSPYDSGKIELTDTLINEGTKAQDYCLLYHTNLGYPLLNEGGKVIVDTESITPVGDYAKSKISIWDTIEPPENNVDETCYYLKPVDRTAVYFNPRSGRKFTMKYGEELNEFVLWKSNASGDYALGLEPATTRLGDELSFKSIGAGESKIFVLSLTIE